LASPFSGAPTPDPGALAGPRPWAGLLAAALVYVGLALILLWPAVGGGQVLSAAGLWARTGPFPAELRQRVPPGVDILSDSTYAYVPFLRYAADRWAQDGRLPYWKSTASCGAPFIGNGESAVFFPTVLLAILIGAPPWVHAATALLKLLGAGLSAYVLARYLRLSWLAAVLCGAIYALGGFQAMYLLFTPTNVSLFLPLMIVAADRLVLAPGVGRLALLAALAALQHLGGHPETAFHSQVLVGLLGLLRAWRLDGRWRRVGLLVLALVAGAALAAFQVLPLAEYIAHSDMLFLRRFARTPIPPLRPWMAAAFLAEVALAVVALHRLKTARSPWLPAIVLFAAVGGGAFVGLQAGMNLFFATMFTPDWFGTVNRYVGPVNYLIANMGSAGVALPLAMLGLLFGAPRHLALGAGVLFGFGLLAGFNAPGLSQLVAALPLFSIAANTRLELYALLAVAVLAGQGIDVLRRQVLPAAAGLRLFLALAAPALGAWLALVAITRQGLIPDTNVPSRLPSDVKIEAGMLPLSTPGLAWPEPLPAGPGKLMLGWMAPTAQPHLVQLLFNQQRDPSVAQVVPLADPAAAGVPGRLDMSRPVYAFRTRLPADKLPPGPTAVRVWASVEGGQRPEVSELLHASDDPGLDELRFPAQPAGGWLDVQLLLAGAIAVATAVALGLAGARWPLVLLVAGVICGLALMLSPLLPFLPPELHYPDPPALGLLRSELPDGRMLQMVPHRFAAELPTYYGVYDVRGYDALCPLHVAFLLRAAANVPGDYAAVELLPQRTDVDRDLLGLMAVKFLTDWAGAPQELVRRHYLGEDTLPFHDPFPVHENDRFLPRARLVSGAVVVDDDEAALAVLRSPRFDRETMAVLASGAGHPEAGPAGPARIVVDTPDFLRIEIEPAVPGWLLLDDSFYPGWTARVDGEERAIVRANVAFRAVEVRPGDRVVEFKYRPLTFRGGLVLSAAAAAGLALLGLRARRQRSPGRLAAASPARMLRPSAPTEPGS
jgi:hypothetical protein